MVYTQPTMEMTSPEEITRLMGMVRKKELNITVDVVATAVQTPLSRSDLSELTTGDWVEFYDRDDTTGHPISEYVQVTGFNLAVGVWYFTHAALAQGYSSATGKVRPVSHFTRTSVPDRYQLERMVIQNQEIFNEWTNHAWFTDGKQVLSKWYEFHSGHRRKYPYFYTNQWRLIDTMWSIIVEHQHMKPLDAAKGDQLWVYDGSDLLDWLDPANGKVEWKAGVTAGARSKDFWCDYGRGVIYFVASRPAFSDKAVKLTYRYGGDYTDDAPPADVSKAVALMTCIDLLRSEPFAVNVMAGMDELSQKGTLMIKVIIDGWEKEIERIRVRRTDPMIWIPDSD